MTRNMKKFKVAVTTTEEYEIEYRSKNELMTAIIEGLPQEQQATADVQIEEVRQ